MSPPGHKTEPPPEGAEVKPRPGPGELVPVMDRAGCLFPLRLSPERWPRRLQGGVRCRLGTGWVVWELRGQSQGRWPVLQLPRHSLRGRMWGAQSICVKCLEQRQARQKHLVNISSL